MAKKQGGTFWKAALLLLVGGAVAGTALLMPVLRCEIVGGSRYAIKEYEAAIGLPERRVAVFMANKKALIAEIERALPYANVVKIERALPGTLRLHVRDSVAAFAQQQGKRWLLISETGQLLEFAEEPPKGALRITGPTPEKPKAGQEIRWKGSRAAGHTLAALMRELRAAELTPEITGIRVTSGPVPDAIYQGRLRLRFGVPPPGAESEAEILREKLRLAKQTIADLDAQNPNRKGILDLSIMGQAYFSANWEN